MGLSEPRKRLKIAHDPRNLSWSTAAPSSSVGHRLMTSQGWSEGQALGARARTPCTTGASTRTGSAANDDDATRLAMSRVGVLFKDDTLGLGAKLKSKDVEGQRTGLDAFANVLGRLNSRTEEEVVRHEREESERKLAGYARGRWGGMMFVPGGVLVQGEGFKSAQEGIEERRKKMVEQKGIGEPERHEGGQVADTTAPSVEEGRSVNEKAEKKRQKEERRRRKEERRLRKSAKAAAAAGEEQQRASKKNKSKKSRSASVAAPDEATSSSDEEAARSDEVSAKQSKTKPRASVVVTETIKEEVPRSGRHVLRGRNIEAKRKAFSDTKGLDAIFMR